jgi:hypothetical protein
MARRKTEEVLNISTRPKRRYLVIDGVKIHILDRQEVTLELGVRLWSIVGTIVEEKKLTVETAKDLADRMKAAVKEILPDLPPAIDAKLSDVQRIDLITTFLKATEPAGAPSTARSLAAAT